MASGFLLVAAREQHSTIGFVAALWSLVYYADFLALMANIDWIDEQEQFEELISVKESGARKCGRWIRKVLR